MRHQWMRNSSPIFFFLVWSLQSDFLAAPGVALVGEAEPLSPRAVGHHWVCGAALLFRRFESNLESVLLSAVGTFGQPSTWHRVDGHQHSSSIRCLVESSQ